MYRLLVALLTTGCMVSPPTDSPADSGLTDAKIDAESDAKVDNKTDFDHCPDLPELSKTPIIFAQDKDLTFAGEVRVSHGETGLVLISTGEDEELFFVNLDEEHQDTIVDGELLWLDAMSEDWWWEESVFILTDPMTHQFRIVSLFGNAFWLHRPIWERHGLDIGYDKGCSKYTYNSEDCHATPTVHPVLIKTADQKVLAFPGETKILRINGVDYDFSVRKMVLSLGGCFERPDSEIYWTLLPSAQ